MKKLILITLLSLSFNTYLFSINPNLPPIKISPKEFNLGDIMEFGDIITKNVELHNTSNKVLEIVKITSDCKCTTGEINNKVLSPNGKATLQISFNPEGIYGPVHRTVNLVVENYEIPVSLTFEANVSPIGSWFVNSLTPINISNRHPGKISLVNPKIDINSLQIKEVKVFPEHIESNITHDIIDNQLIFNVETSNLSGQESQRGALQISFSNKQSLIIPLIIHKEATLMTSSDRVFITPDTPTAKISVLNHEDSLDIINTNEDLNIEEINDGKITHLKITKEEFKDDNLTSQSIKTVSLFNGVETLSFDVMIATESNNLD